MDDEMYNRICQLVWLEEVRICNEVTERMNFIFKYRPTDADAYIKLAQAKAKKEYFDDKAFSFLRWLRGFVEE